MKSLNHEHQNHFKYKRLDVVKRFLTTINKSFILEKLIILFLFSHFLWRESGRRVVRLVRLERLCTRYLRGKSTYSNKNLHQSHTEWRWKVLWWGRQFATKGLHEWVWNWWMLRNWMKNFEFFSLWICMAEIIQMPRNPLSSVKRSVLREANPYGLNVVRRTWRISVLDIYPIINKWKGC